MKDSGMYEVIVKGRISSVAWLENAPFNAKKVKGSQYFQYEMIVGENEVRQIDEDLEGVEKVWFSTSPVQEWEAPHPAYAGMATMLESNPKARTQLSLGHLWFAKADNDECQEFAELQIEKILRRVTALRKNALAQEVERMLDEVHAHGGEAYGKYKARLQEITNLI